MTSASLRDLPAVHLVLELPELAAHRLRLGREAVLEAVRAAIEEARGSLIQGEPAAIDPASLALRAAAILDDDRGRLRPVLNATGILLHTGLGRAPLASEAIEAVAAVARGYCNLELDLATGEREKRTTSIGALLCRLTGAEAATVVNNNAGATVLALRALAAGREVIVSRGQLIEIGGSFRLPEIFAVSGARLVEVGTTNRTRLSDYERAIGHDTAALLRVHPSNYRVVGFTESVAIADIAALARSRGKRTIDDIGSGAVRAGLPPGIAGTEPTIAEGLAAGADLVLCSGDKLLGGPQCGLMLGKHAAIARVETDPLMRALRVDKMTLAALEATLRLMIEPARAAHRVPLWAFLNTPVDSLRDRAERLAGSFRRELGLNATIVDAVSYLGGGSLPGEPIPTAAIRVAGPMPAPWPSEAAWTRALRAGDPAVVPRVSGGAVVFDLRAIDPADDETLLEAVRHATVRGEDSPGE
jgi:L-seryl-tRNA(Ser) seleniumtransferase